MKDFNTEEQRNREEGARLASTRRVRLGDVCEISRSVNPCMEDNVWLLNLDMVEQQTGRILEKLVVDRKEVGSSTVPFDTQCVLYSKLRPNLNKVVLPDSAGYATSEMLPLVPFDSLVTREYLAAYLRSAHFVRYATSKSFGAKMPRLGSKDLMAATLPLPPFPTQRRIAAVLDKICELKRNAEMRLQKLQLLAQSRFVEMFGDSVSTNRWPLTTVAEVADVCVGVVIKPAQYYCDDGVRTFRSLNIGEMRIRDKEWVFFTKDGHARNQKSVVHTNDVLVVRSGTPGTACVVTSEYDGCNAVDIIIAHPDTKKVDPIYLAMFTNMPHGMSQIRQRTGGAAQQHFNVGGYKNLHLPLPPLSLQRSFAAFVAQLDKLECSVRKSIEWCDTLYRAKLQEYFG